VLVAPQVDDENDQQQHQNVVEEEVPNDELQAVVLLARPVEQVTIPECFDEVVFVYFYINLIYYCQAVCLGFDIPS